MYVLVIHVACKVAEPVYPVCVLVPYRLGDETPADALARVLGMRGTKATFARRYGIGTNTRP